MRRIPLFCARNDQVTVHMYAMPDTLRDELQAALGVAFPIVRELGGGGMSRVFVATDTRLEREIVVKVLMPELAAGISAERFTREIKLTAQLQEPHIVPVLADGVTSGGLPWYTMPFVRGESLRARLAAGAVPVNDAIALLRGVAAALEYAHARGVVHRDIKPENVLLSGRTAVVTDFGIAKALSASRALAPDSTAAMTQVGTSLGTPGYMAPEQAAGDPETNERADLYSWGVIAYELLAGAHPFAGRSAHAMVVAHMTETPLSLAERCADCSPAVAALVTRCLDKDPALRPQSASEILDAIDGPDNGRAPLTAATAAASPSASRSRALLSTAATLTVVAAAAIAWFLFGKSAPPTLSVESIAVAPFRVAGADPSLAYLREGMVDLLASKLAAGTLAHAVDPRTLLAAWRKAGGAESDLAPVAAARVARAVGAGQLLLGSVVGTSRAMTVSAVLMASVSGDTVASVEVQGPADSLSSLVEQLTARLLTLRAGEGEQRLGLATRTSLMALRPYLEGRALLRRGRFADAVSRFNTSLDADSTFALAALGLVDAAGFGTEGTHTRRGIRVLQRFGAQLSPRDRAEADIHLALYSADGRPGRWRLAAERLLALAPDSPDGAYRLGEWMYHYGSLAGVADADRQGIALFTRALALDPAYAPALDHLADLYLTIGDTSLARKTVGQLAALDSTAENLAAQQFMVASATGDSVWVRSLRDRLERMDAASLGTIVAVSRGGTIVGVTDGARALAALERMKGVPAAHAAIAHLDWGQPAASARALSREKGVARSVLAILLSAYALGDTALARSAAENTAASLDTMPNTIAARLMPLWILGVHAMAIGDTAGVRARSLALKRIPAMGDTLGLRASRDGAALQLDVQLAVAQRSPELRALTVQLDSITRAGMGELIVEMSSGLVLSRAWETLGDLPRARDAVARRLRAIAIWPYSAPNLREGARLAELAGDREGAIRAWRSYVRLRANAEPSMRADLDAARAAVARLERESAGQ